MPYVEDPSKRSRYVAFLEHSSSIHGADTNPPDRPSTTSRDDWIKELLEFAHAATIFKPMSGAMASRFTSSSTTSPDVKSKDDESGTPPLLRQAKGKSPAEEAAAAGMYGPLTRQIETWFPTRLLCKRFNVQVPIHVHGGSGEGGGQEAEIAQSTALPGRKLELVGKREMDELRGERHWPDVRK